MKKAGLVLLVLVVFFLYNSCTKDKATPPPPASCVATYNVEVKPILDLHCAQGGCHDSNSLSGGIDLSKYSVAKDATINHRVLCTIDRSCTPYMPLGQTKLADSLIAIIQCWKANGCPEK